MLLGIIFIIIGAVIRFFVLRQYGIQLRLLQPDVMFDKGMYKYIRHPAYLGGMMLFAGILLLVFNAWQSLAIMYIAVHFFIDRIDREEQLMYIKFKDKYAEYMRRTKMLIPFIF